jgi:hypothetical protein
MNHRDLEQFFNELALKEDNGSCGKVGDYLKLNIMARRLLHGNGEIVNELATAIYYFEYKLLKHNTGYELFDKEVGSSR